MDCGYCVGRLAPSELRGRSAVLADGLSRQDEVHRDLLQKEVKRLKDISVRELLLHEEEAGDEHPWALTSHHGQANRWTQRWPRPCRPWLHRGV